MVYIGTAGQGELGVYLDVHSIERFGGGLRVNATVGDGCYEGEVLIECGGDSQVTFADAWLGGQGLHEFLQRCGQGWLEGALLDAVRSFAPAVPRVARTPRPHAGRPPHPPGRCAESRPVWHSFS